MPFFQTSTPVYRQLGENSKPTPAQSRGLLTWLASLFRTPTPAYKTLPPPETSDPDEPPVSPLEPDLAAKQ